MQQMPLFQYCIRVVHTILRIIIYSKFLKSNILTVSLMQIVLGAIFKEYLIIFVGFLGGVRVWDRVWTRIVVNNVLGSG